MNSIADIQNPENIVIVDWEVHQLIELERRGFDEPPIEALRRLLGIAKGERPRVRVPAGRELPATHWEGDGLSLENGTEIRFSYRKNSKPIMGKIEGGKISAAGKIYDNLSAAANDLAVTRAGKKTRLNGWLYWSMQSPAGSGNWVVLDSLRKR